MPQREDVILIRKVDLKVHECLKILAEDRECTIGELVRPMTKKIIEIFKDMPCSTESKKVVVVPGMNTSSINEFKEIKDKTGINGGIILNLALYMFLKDQSSFSKSLFEGVFSTSSMSIPEDLT